MKTVRRALPFILAMALVVTISNVLVRFPFDHFGLKDILTWGAFSYPFAFLVTDLANRRHGMIVTRRTIWAGFGLAVLLSLWLATPRIAIASGSAFLAAQFLDAFVFDRLRNSQWWQAPLLSTIAGSVLDTAMFFSLAFAAPFAILDTMAGLPDGSLGFAVPFFTGEAPLWVSLAAGDFMIKIGCGLALLAPYRVFVSNWLAGAANNQ